MSYNSSPLRYPGGKSCLLHKVSEILSLNKLERRPYGEPYAGGCGLALSLLYGGYVSEIHINDIDKGIWSFWNCVLNETQELIHKINTTKVTIDEWHNQKEIIKSNDIKPSLILGFATFFLNRTNRSGIIKNAGVIGGFSQKGNYKLDCRFNKEALINRIQRIAKYRKRIHLTNLDAIDFIKTFDHNNSPSSFLCIDPPYFNQGSKLYTNFYNAHDHEQLRNTVRAYKKPWIITYDNTDEIKQLYRSHRQYEFNLNYSVQEKRLGKEVMIASKKLKMPSELRESQINKSNYKAA